MKFNIIITSIFILGVAVTCRGHSASLFELRRASIELGAYPTFIPFQKSHNAYLLLDNEREWLDKKTSMIMNVDLICSSSNYICLFWNNRIEGKASNKQYRQIGWIFNLGLSLSDKFELGWSHLSEHELDRKTNSSLPYPVENVIYLEMKFVDRPRIIR